MIALVKIFASVVLVLTLLIWVSVTFKRHFKSASITLFTEGWILTHPQRKAVAFDNATDAKRYIAVCDEAGLVWTCHALYKGKLTLVEIGDTIIY